MDSQTPAGADTDGILDEALTRLHAAGPETAGQLSNHAPMAVEALARHGQSAAVHRWIDHYQDQLADMPAPSAPVTDANWQEALGDPRRLADWTAYFARAVDDRPWQDVLAAWWPRLLPGIIGHATHPAIRTGHAVRTLLGQEQTAPRRAELAHALGYWAARHTPLPSIPVLPAARSAREGLAVVPRVEDRSGGVLDRVGRIRGLPARPGPASPGPEEARELLSELVRATTHRYATHAHSAPVLLVHAATAPNAVLRVLPALPRELWLPSVDVAWAASAAVTAAYAPAEGVSPPDTGGRTDEDLFARATAHGDAHVVKLADTALDAAALDLASGEGDGSTARAAILRATGLIEPALHGS